MEIINRQKYQIKGKSRYFKKKYKTYNPIIWIEDLVTNMPGKKTWRETIETGNLAAILYSDRREVDCLPDDELVYYGKIESPGVGMLLGEMVHVSELEEIKPKTFWQKLFRI